MTNTFPQNQSQLMRAACGSRTISQFAREMEDKLRLDVDRSTFSRYMSGKVPLPPDLLGYCLAEAGKLYSVERPLDVQSLEATMSYAKSIVAEVEKLSRPLRPMKSDQGRALLKPMVRRVKSSGKN